MNPRLRTAVVATALAIGFSPAVAFADGSVPSCEDAAGLHAAVVAAQQQVTDAKAAFKAANRPLGRLVAAKRHEARTELAQSRTAMKQLRAQLRHGGDDAVTVRAELRAEQRDVAHARNLLQFKRALLREIKTDRAEARTTWRAARADLAELESTEESCDADAGATDSGTTDGDPADTGSADSLVG